jgi:hypothetical protein
MNMKKNFILIFSAVIFLGLICIGIFWLVGGQESSGLEFLPVQGEFIVGPTVEQFVDTYTVTWVTASDYSNNEVVMKKSMDQYPEAAVGAITVYDEANNGYTHTARFRLTNQSDASDIPVFTSGNYSYQVKSSGPTDQDQIVSLILPL